jgi:hypothetical protein
MNAALPVEEAYRILTDEKQNGHLVLLDAKMYWSYVVFGYFFLPLYLYPLQRRTILCRMLNVCWVAVRSTVLCK